MGISRRNAILGVGAAAVGGLVVDAAQATATELAQSVPLPDGGYASAIRLDRDGPSCAAGTVHWWGDRTSRRIALTFDDGPHPTWTPALLEVLAVEDVRATFFVKGVAVTANPRVHQGSVGTTRLATTRGIIPTSAASTTTPSSVRSAAALRLSRTCSG